MSVTSNAPTLIPTSAGTPISFSELRGAFKERSTGPISARELLRDTDLNNDNPIVPDCTENSAIAAPTQSGAVWTTIYGNDDVTNSGNRVVFQNFVYTFWYEGVEVGTSPSGTWPPSDVNSFISQINKRFSVGDLFVDNGNVIVYKIIVEESSGLDWSIDILRNKIKYYYMTQSGTILNLDLDNPKNTSSGYADWNNNISKNIVKTLTINGTLGSNEPRTPATTMDAEVRNMTIKVNGNIYGAGGEGGPYYNEVYGITYLTGEDGGEALYVKSTATQPKTKTINVQLNNSAKVYAGGGGGGRGGYGGTGGFGGGTVTWPGGTGGEGGVGGKGGTGRGYNNLSGSIIGTNGIAGGTGGSGSTMTWKDAKDSTLNDSTGTYYKPQWVNKTTTPYQNPRNIYLRVKGSGWQSVWVRMRAQGGGKHLNSDERDTGRTTAGVAYYKAVFDETTTPTKDYGIRHRHFCNYSYEWSEGSMNDFKGSKVNKIRDRRDQFDVPSKGNHNHYNIKEPVYSAGKAGTGSDSAGFDGYAQIGTGWGEGYGPRDGRMSRNHEGVRYQDGYYNLGWVYCGTENSVGYHDIKVSIWGRTYDPYKVLVTTESGGRLFQDADGTIREFGVQDGRSWGGTNVRGKGRSLTKDDTFNPGIHGNDRNTNVRGQVAGYNWDTKTWSSGAGGNGGDGGRGGDGGTWGISGDIGTDGLPGLVGYDSDTATYIQTNNVQGQQYNFNVTTPYIGPYDDPRERSKNPKADQYGHEKLDVEFYMTSSIGKTGGGWRTNDDGVKVRSGFVLPNDIDLWIKLNGIIMSRWEWCNVYKDPGGDDDNYTQHGVSKWNFGLDIPHRHQAADINYRLASREGGSGSRRNPYYPSGVAGLVEPLTGFGTRYELLGAVQSASSTGPDLGNYTNITDHLEIQSDNKKIRLYKDKTGENLSGEWIEIRCNVGRFSKENNKFYWRTDANHWSWGLYGMTQNASTVDFNSSVPGNIVKDLQPSSYYGPIWAETKSKVSGPAKMVEVAGTHLYINDLRKRSDMGINGDGNMCMAIWPTGAGFVTGKRNAIPPSDNGAIGAGGGESGKAVDGDNYRVTGTLTDNTLKGDY